MTLAVIALSLIACDDPAPERRSAVRDSAGVTIVESGDPRWGVGVGWSVAEEPSVVIGEVEGPPEYTLSQVTAPIRLDDGTIVFGTNGTAELRFYDETGRHLRSAGRQGEGPGDFGYIGTIGRYGRDSLVVWDVNLHRVSVWDRDGNFGRTFAGPADGAYAVPGVFHDGVLLIRRFQPSAVSGLNEDSATLARMTPSGDVEELGTFFDAEWFTGTSGSSIRRPYGRSGELDVEGDRFYHADGASLEIREFDEKGTVLRILRTDRPRRPVTEDEITALVDRMTSVGLPSLRESRAELYAELSFPDLHPALRSIEVDAAGNVWVLTGGSSWTVFGADGRLLGDVEMPEGLAVAEIGEDHVLGRARDELRVQRVVVHPLIKTGPGSE